MPNIYDCIVIGLGGFGSSTAFHLVKRGLRVLGIEQFSPVHDRGSSHGKTRIIRRVYFEHPNYVPLLNRAYDLWDELELATGRKLFHRSGLVYSGPAQGTMVSGLRRAAQTYDLVLQEVISSAAKQKYPGFRFPEDHDVLFEEDAGFLEVEECVRAHLDRARACSADLHFNEPVRSWTSTGKTVQIETERDRYEASALVIAGGAWSDRLIKDALPPLRVLRKVLFWLGIESGRSDDWVRGPAFFFDMPSAEFYGFPSQDGQTVKLAEHTGGSEVADPAAPDRGCYEADVAPIRDFATVALRGVSPVPAEHAVCMYTMSPDSHFLIDRHPEYENVILAAGFSGHGFKFTSVIGEALADLVSPGTTPLPIGFLGLDRFAS